MRDLLADVLRDASARVRCPAPGASFLERHLDDAVRDALNERAPGVPVQLRRTLPVPGWEPQPGGIDLVADLERGRIVSEHKIDDVPDLLWDAVKVLCLAAADEGTEAVLMAAAPPRTWERAQVAELFRPEGQGPWASADLFVRWPEAWTWLLRNGRARPRRMPDRFEAVFLGRATVAAFPDYELRGVLLRPSRGHGWLSFGQDGWPHSATPPAATVRALLAAYIEAQAAQEGPAGEEARARYAALSAAAGFDLDALPGGEESFLRAAVGVLRDLRSPFADWLEAPPSVTRAHAAHGARIDATLEAARAAQTAMLEDIIADVLAAGRED